MKEEPFRCLTDNPDTGSQKQCGFDECREVLELAVAVLMRRVGRPIGNTHGKIGNGCSYQVEPRVGSFRQDAQAAGSNTNHHLEARDDDGRTDRVQSDCALLGAFLSSGNGICHPVIRSPLRDISFYLMYHAMIRFLLIATPPQASQFRRNTLSCCASCP